MLQGNEQPPIQEVSAAENRSPFSSTLLNQNIVVVDKESAQLFGKVQQVPPLQSIFSQSTAIEKIINRTQASSVEQEEGSRDFKNSKQLKKQKQQDIKTSISKAKTQTQTSTSQVQGKQPLSEPVNLESQALAGMLSPVSQQKRAQNFKDYLNSQAPVTSQTPLNASKQLAQRTHSPFLNSLSPRQWQIGNMAKMESQISSHKSSFGKRSPLKLDTFQNKKNPGKSQIVNNNNNQRVSQSQTPDQLCSLEKQKTTDDSNLNPQGINIRLENEQQNLKDLSLNDLQNSREISYSPNKKNQAQDRRFYNILSSQQAQVMNEYSATVKKENLFKAKNQKDQGASINNHQSNDVAELKKQKKTIQKRFSHQNRQSNADKLRLNPNAYEVDPTLAPYQNGDILIDNQIQTEVLSNTQHYLNQQINKAPQTSPTLKLSSKNERVSSKLKQDEQRLLQNLSSNAKLIQQNLQLQSPFKSSFAANNFPMDARSSQNLTDQKIGQPLGSLENNSSSNLESKRALLNQSESQNLYHNRYNMYRNKYNNILKQTLMTESTESQSALNEQHQRTQIQNQSYVKPPHQNQQQSSNLTQLNTNKMVEQNGVSQQQIYELKNANSYENQLQAQRVDDHNTFYQTLDSQARLKSLTTQKKSHTLSNQFEDIESARFAESDDKLLLLSTQNQTKQMKMVPYQDELFQLDNVYGQQQQNSKWGLIKDASKRQLSQDISMKGNFDQLLLATNSKFQKTQYYKQAQLNHINRIIDRKSINNLEPITQSQEGFLPNIDSKKGQNQSKLKLGKLNQPSQNASNQNSQSQIQGKVKHQISVGGGISYQGYSNNIKATINHALDSKGFNHTKQGRFRQPSIAQGQIPCSQSKEQSMVDIQEMSRDDQGDQSQSKLHNQEDSQMLQNHNQPSNSKENLLYRGEYKETNSQAQPQNISHLLVGHQNTQNFHLTNFNLKNCLDIKVPFTSVVSQQKQLNTQMLSNQVPLSGATLQLPVPTDKMISYQSFSPANVIKKSKPLKGFGKGSQTQELQDHQAQPQQEKRGSSLVQKQKFLRQKMKLNQYQHFQGKMIPFQALSSLEINQESHQQQNTQSPGQMLLTGNNVNRLLESLCSTNKYSQPYKDTHFSNHQEQFSSKLEVNSMSMQQAALALQNQLSQLHSGMSVQDGQLILEKFGLSLRSSDGREIENMHQKITPTLMICSMNSVLKSHLQTHSLGDKPQKKLNNQTLKSSASNQTLPALSPGAKSLVLREIQSQGEAIDKLDSSLSNFQIKRDAQIGLENNQHNQMNTATEEDDDEEDDQSECLSVKSHDSYQANDDEYQDQNDRPPLTERENNQDFGDRLADSQPPPHSSSGLSKITEQQNTKVNSKFLTSTKIQLKPIQIQQGQKYVNSQQFQSQTPQSFKPPFKKGVNQKEREIKQQQESKNEMIKRLQARKQEYLQVSLQNQQLILKGKKKKSYGNVLCTIPKNLKDQETQFFASNFTVNPNFQYENYGMTQRYVQEFTFKPDESLLKIAVKIIEAFLKEYGSEKDFIEREGRLLSREETEAYFQKYISDLELEDYLALNFTSKAIAPTSITHGSHGKKSKINICLPIDYSEGRILGVMHHEIGTHFVRKFNDKYQAWAGKRAIFSMMGSLDTEEGLACINQQLENTCFHKGESNLELKPYLFRPALYYYCCHQAQQLSFVDLFADLGKYIADPHRRWKYVMRVKRGLQNTQEPGGFYKDQVYLRGAVEILKNRDKFDLQDLYAGKIAIEDVLMITLDVKKVKLNKDKGSIKLPGFLQDMNLYKRAIDEIAKVNFIK